MCYLKRETSGALKQIDVLRVRVVVIAEYNGIYLWLFLRFPQRVKLVARVTGVIFNSRPSLAFSASTCGV